MNFNFLNRDKLFGLATGMLLFPLIQQAAPFFTVGLLASFQERAIFPLLEQRIEVVRRAAAQVHCPPTVADAPIVAAVLDWNLRVVHEQEANRRWLTDLFSTDRWDEIRPIPMPCEETP